MRTRWVLVLGLGLSLLFWAPSAMAGEPKTPSAEDKKKAKGLYEEAGRHYEAKDYESALASYREAYLTIQHPSLLFNIAQCYRLLGRHRNALESYELFLKDNPETPLRAEVEGLLVDLRVLVAAEAEVGASVEVSCDREGAEVYLDGALSGTAPLRLEKISPGEHVIEVRGEGRVPYSQTVTLEAGQNFVIQVSLPKERGGWTTSRRVLLGAAITGALGLAAGGLGLATALSSKRLQEEGDFFKSREKRDLAARLGNVTDVLVLSALAAGGVGVYLRKKENKPEAVVYLSPYGVALSAEF